MHLALNFIDSALGLSATKAEELSVLQVCARAVVVFIVLIAYMRIAKKRFLGEATAFDAILVIVMGSIASRGVSGTAPFFPSLAGALVFILMHWIVSFFAVRWRALSFLVKGHDTLVIKDGRVQERAPRAAHMSEDDLAEDLRAHGVTSAADVAEARLERSGSLSVIKNKKSG